MSFIKLGRRDVDDHSEPYVIAEIGVNHEGSLEKARELIDLASDGGADGAKFQTYKAETLASKHSPSYWNLDDEPTTSQFELFKKYDRFEREDYEALADHCRVRKIDFLSTPFDLDSVDFLDPLIPFFKIASADLTNVPLLRKIAGRRKPVVLSTGASTLDEVSGAVSTLRGAGCQEVVLMHCVLNYPTAYEDAHLNMIEGLKQQFPAHVIGYSDHTVPDSGMAVLLAAYLKGARVIEKHFTHDKTLPGNDHYHAMDVEDLALFRRQLSLIRRAEGDREKAVLPSEEISRRNARRSIVLAVPVEKGQELNEAALICKRPGTGISPLDWDRVVGMRVARRLEEDHILGWDDLEPNGDGAVE